MKTKVFNGAHLAAAVTRTISTPDPGNPSRMLTSRKKFDLITGLVIERVSGIGKAEKTGEQYITLSGQYAPFGTARITASAQNADAVIAMLKDNVDKTNPALLVLKEEITVEVVATPMRGFGFAVQELYLVNPDGTRKAIIGAPEASVQENTLENALL